MQVRNIMKPSPLMPDFKPPFYMRPAMVQTGLASLKFRKAGHSDMQMSAQHMTLECGIDETGEDVQLMGSYSRAAPHKGLIIFLHGWEGSQESTYVVSTARQMFNMGLSIFRLNYRDHGDTHHLNTGIFLATRFAEVFEAVRQAAALSQGMPVYIVGFSLGGNFALRIARALEHKPIADLVHIFSISPVIDPWPAAPLVDEGYFIQRYFKKKLIATLKKKQSLYPDVHDFTEALNSKTIMDMSEHILPQYSGYPDLETYFTAYRIWPDDLANCKTPTSLIMAKDDPVVPAQHIDSLKLSESCRDIRLNYGGHNGFFKSFMGPTWYDSYMKQVIFA